MTKLKICGLTRQEDVEAAIEIGADYIGFIHADGSPRNLSIQQMRALMSWASEHYPECQRVVVTTITDPHKVQRLADELNPDWIQLHSDIVAKQFNQITFKQKIKVVRVGKSTDFSNVDDYDAPLLLMDTYDDNRAGGTGSVFDWSIIPERYLSRTMIAGGLNPDNVGALLSQVSPYGIDVNSGVETSPGFKSQDRFIQLQDALASIGFYKGRRG